VCHKKYAFGFLTRNHLLPKLLGNLKRNFQRAFTGAFGSIGKDKSSQMPENFAALNVTAAQKQIDISPTKRLFIDDFLIEKTQESN